MKNFTVEIIQVFEKEYLRKSAQANVDCLLQVAEALDFSSMLGSIDCKHWEWKNCPSGWKEMFAKRIYRVFILILEAICSYDFWIWHAFFGCTGKPQRLKCPLLIQCFSIIISGSGIKMPICRQWS